MRIVGDDISDLKKQSKIHESNIPITLSYAKWTRPSVIFVSHIPSSTLGSTLVHWGYEVASRRPAGIRAQVKIKIHLAWIVAIQIKVRRDMTNYHMYSSAPYHHAQANYP